MSAFPASPGDLTLCTTCPPRPAAARHADHGRDRRHPGLRGGGDVGGVTARFVKNRTPSGPTDETHGEHEHSRRQLPLAATLEQVYESLNRPKCEGAQLRSKTNVFESH